MKVNALPMSIAQPEEETNQKHYTLLDIVRTFSNRDAERIKLLWQRPSREDILYHLISLVDQPRYQKGYKNDRN